MYERSKNSFPSEKLSPIYYDFCQYMSYCGSLRIRYAALKTKKDTTIYEKTVVSWAYSLNEIDVMRADTAVGRRVN